MAKILIVTANLPSFPRNGTGTRQLYIIKHLSKKHNIVVLTLITKGMEKDIETLQEYCRVETILTDPILNEASAKRLAKFKLTRQLLSRLPSILYLIHSCKQIISGSSIKMDNGILFQKMRHRIKELIEKENFDVIQIEHVEIASLATCIKKKIPLIIDVHSLLSSMAYRKFKFCKGVLNKVLNLLDLYKTILYERNILGYFSNCITVSEQEGNKLTKINQCPHISVIPNGVDITYFAPIGTDKIDPKRLIFIGPMTYEANADAIDYFYRKIFPLIKKRCPSVKLCILGHDPSGFLKQLKDDKNVIACGFVDDIRPYIASSGIFIAPIRLGAGTRLKIVEAMAMGKPVVSTSVGADGLCVRHRHNIILANSPTQFSEAVLELIENKKLCAELGKNGRDLVEKYYCWNTILPKIDYLYETLPLLQGER